MKNSKKACLSSFDRDSTIVYFYLSFLFFSPAPPRWGIGVRETNGVIEIEVENDGMEREKKGACYFLFEWVDTKSIQLVFHDLAIKVMKSCAVYITDHM